MLRKQIYYIVENHSDKLTIGKTIVQKILYLAMQAAERGRHFEPYHYGPYSHEVQYDMNSMVKLAYFDYDQEKYRLSIKPASARQLHYNKEERALQQRIDKVIDFLCGRNITSTKDIAIFSKIHMFVCYNADKTLDNFPAFIQQRSKMMKWPEVAALSAEKIQSLIDTAREFESQMP